MRADELARSAPRKGWQRLSAGRGSKGHRLYDWLLLDPGADEHQLLVHRSISKPDELAYYICHARHPCRWPNWSRWAVEETFQFAKNETDAEDLIALSCNEIRRLWATLTDPAHTNHWSDWRRRHQTRARHSHYQRQRIKPPRLLLPY